MKRTYIIPSIMVVRMQTARMVAVSGSGVISDKGISFGGIVGEGDGITPEVKANKNIWDNEW